MIISLPIKQYNKYIFIPFNIIITNDLITITPINNECKIYHIILYSESFGINTLPLSFPLYFNIINNNILCEHFYIFQALSTQHNNIDFLSILLNSINKYKLYNNMNISNLITILKLNNDNSHIVNENIISLINKNYYRISKYINFCLAILLESKINISQTSKITQIINLIKQLKIEFFGNICTVEEHLEYINNPKLIKKKRFYFYEKNDKILKIYIGDNNNKENLSAYPSKYKKHINIKNLINILIINYFDKLFEIVCKVLFKKYPNIINLLICFINNKSLVYNDSIIEYEISNNNINNIHKLSFNKFKDIIDNNDNYDENIFNELINDYTYPINYDKRILNENFAKILYYYFKFNINIKIIANVKIKILLHNILKIYKHLQTDNINCLNNYKIYNDNLLYNIFKILFYNDTFNLFINNDSIKYRFTSNIIIIQVINNLSWINIAKDFFLLKYIISIKDNCSDLIISDGKFNKCYNIDNRIKKIIIDPITMLNYLKKEEDFIKCILNFKNYIGKIFNNMIQLDNNDYNMLSKILYFYSKIKEQNFNDVYYKKLIKYSKMNIKLMIFNDRINIKLKDIFKNININLGFMARDITNEETISISDDLDTINEYTETINKLKRKYYKYKGKYLEMKCTTEINTEHF